MVGTQGEAEPRPWLPFSRRRFRAFVRRLALLLPALPSDDRVDAWLDRLRDGDGARLVLPAPAQVLSCWVAAAAVLAYYGARHAAAALALPRCAGGGSAKSRRRRVPLMLEARTKKAAPPGGDPRDRDRDIYDELREELARSGLIVAEDGTSPPSVAGREEDDRRRRRWVDAIRGDASLRRRVSRFLQLDDETARRIDAPLWDLLDSIYPDLLPLPSSRRGGTRGPGSGRNRRRRHVYEVSAVVPFHDGEPPDAVRRTLRELFVRCRDPRRAQLVLVRATVADDSNADEAAARDGDGDEKRRWRADDVVASLVDPDHRAGWGDVQLVTRAGGGGRGPALNAGAAACGGRVAAFVHADCLVPDGWDLSIRSALPADGEDDGDKEGRGGRRSPPRVVATAFRLGIDFSQTSPWLDSLFGFPRARSGALDAERSAGLEGAEDRRYPWGIRAVELMVNVRSSWLNMPYGDQALAMRLDDFFYLGGFPQQPIMEDYEFVSHLRLRASRLPAPAGRGREILRVLPDACRCSPRRWQSHGVLYVTLANAVLVHRYTRAEEDPRRWDPDRVFEYYYRRRPPPSTQRDDKAG